MTARIQALTAILSLNKIFKDKYLKYLDIKVYSAIYDGKL